MCYHDRYRIIVNCGFTPRMIARFNDDVRAQARAIVDDVAAPSEADLVADIAARLPGHVDASLLGVPPEGQAIVQRHTNAFIAPSDPEYGGTAKGMVAASDAIVNAAVPDSDGNLTRISMQDFAEFV